MPGLVSPLCPYCKHELAEGHKHLGSKLGAEDQGVMVCDGCGEPVMWTKTGFRKPTDDEMLEIHEQSPIRAAREAWIEANKQRAAGDQPLLARCWAETRNSLERDEISYARFKSDVQLFRIFRGVFMKGAEAMMFIHQAASKSDSHEQFVGRMMLIEAEIKAFFEQFEEFEL